jgi:hypothetical protein
MKTPRKDASVGYGNPPRSTRWKKGQSGNPSRRYPARSRNLVEMIDSLFMSPINLVENGVTRRVTTLEAIILQLWRQEVSGDDGALAVRLKYEKFASQNSARRVEIAFVDSDYTRVFAGGPPGGKTGND